MPIKNMTVAQWIAVPDNPIQRDTERHAAKAKHLLTPLSIHAIVYAAELPDGKLVKLDGHTRALLWKRNQVKHPRVVEVNLIPVDTMAEAMALYQTLDSRDALETIWDKISGAFGEQHFKPTSGLVQRGAFATPLKACMAILRGYSIGSSGSGGNKHISKPVSQFNIYDAVREFGTEIYALDAFQLHTGDANGGVVTAFILTYRKYGMRIVPFWRAVFGKGGTKIDGKMDAVEALCSLIVQRKGHSMGSNQVWDIASRAVKAAEVWLENEQATFTAIPRPYDLTNYIKNLKPQFNLIKTAESRDIEKSGDEGRAA